MQENASVSDPPLQAWSAPVASTWSNDRPMPWMILFQCLARQFVNQSVTCGANR